MSNTPNAAPASSDSASVDDADNPWSAAAEGRQAKEVADGEDGGGDGAAPGDAVSAGAVPQEVALEPAPARKVMVLGAAFNFDDYPDEVYLSILRHLPTRQDLFRCALTCHRMSILFRDSFLWEAQCSRTWPDPVKNASLVSQYDNHYRVMFERRPFLRFEGVFLGRSGYRRKGYNEDAWIQPTHSVVYYRYLRFFPDGTVIYATNSENPLSFIEHFRAGNRKALVNEGVYEANLDEGIVSLHLRNATTIIRMELSIKSTRPAGNNRLVTVRHTIMEESLGVEQSVLGGDKEMPKFYFQKLRQNLLDVV